MNKPSPLFQRRHYEALAETLAAGFAAANLSPTQANTLAQGLAGAFERDNPRFRLSDWNKALGLFVGEGAK